LKFSPPPKKKKNKPPELDPRTHQRKPSKGEKDDRKEGEDEQFDFTALLETTRKRQQWRREIHRVSHPQMRKKNP
jgi:2-methylcitrate dehydratase PrpD